MRHYDLRFDHPKQKELLELVLPQNPISVGLQTALVQNSPYKEWVNLQTLNLSWDKEKEAYYLPHEKDRQKLSSVQASNLPSGIDLANPRKHTPAWINEIDRGTAQFLEDTPTYKKIQFEGEKLQGIWTMNLDDSESDMWIFEHVENSIFQIKSLGTLFEWIQIQESIQGVKISGDVLTEGRWKGIFYPKWLLKKVALDFRGIQLRVFHGDKAGDVVGWVTDTSWNEKEKAIKYEALVLDAYTAAEILGEHLLFNSPRMDVEILEGPNGEKTARKLIPRELTLTNHPASYQSRIHRKKVHIVENVELVEVEKIAGKLREKEALERGKGQGVGGSPQKDGGAAICVCPECGAKAPHVRGIPCSEIKCSKCGAFMQGISPDKDKAKDIPEVKPKGIPKEKPKEQALEVEKIKFFVCPRCGYTEPAKAGVLASTKHCPTCKISLVGATVKGQTFLSFRSEEVSSALSFARIMQHRYRFAHSNEDQDNALKINAQDLDYVVLAPKGSQYPYKAPFRSYPFYSKMEQFSSYPLPTYPYPLKIDAVYLDSIIVVPRETNQKLSMVKDKSGSNVQGQDTAYIVLIPKKKFPKTQVLQNDFPLPTGICSMEVEGRYLGYVHFVSKGRN